MSREELPLQGQHVLVLTGDIYEDLELWYPKLRLIEAGAVVTVAAEEAGRQYAGKNGYPCVSDVALMDVDSRKFDALVVPGGFMPDKLRRLPIVLDLVRSFFEANDSFLSIDRPETILKLRLKNPAL